MNIEISNITIKNNIVRVISPHAGWSAGAEIVLQLDYGFDTILYYDILDKVITYINSKSITDSDSDVDDILNLIPQLKLYIN